jgi:Flagellar hook-length control protein FliK
VIVQPAAWRSNLAQAVTPVTRVSLAHLLSSAGSNAQQQQALVNALRSSGMATARVLETRADGVTVLELASVRVAIRLTASPAPGEAVLIQLEDATAFAAPAPEVKLSRSAQLINDILKPALNQAVNETMAAVPMTEHAATPQSLAHALQQAVRASGLFYESHLRGWVDGRIALADLSSEPQARVTTASPQPAGEPQNAGEPRHVVHPQLEPLVRQQLDTFEHQRIAWHGPLWPDQQAEIVITGEPQTAETQTPRAWRVQLELHTPTLGKVSADIALSGRSLKVRVNGESAGLRALREGRAALEQALSAHDLDVNAVHVTGAAP